MPFLSFTWNPSEGIDLGFFLVRYYSLMFVIAFTLGWFITKKIFKNENQSLEKLDSLFIYMVVAILLGARLGHVIFYQSELIFEDPISVLLPFRTVPEFEYTGFQGLASHGAAIGVIIAMFLYSKKVLKKPVLWILDRVVIAVASGAIFVRIGNFINSEIIGKATNSDFGVIFKQLGETFPRHPAQLYESAGYVVVFLILWFTYWKTEKSKQLGYLFGLFLVLLWTVRFFVEFVKESQGGFESALGQTLSTGQWLSIPFIIAGVYFMVQSKKKPTV
ncbi:prolipoprotein diacylglyceryl transferase [Ulvibacter litoralis]|uniref:Phosphatidylglycerol--prolipoprotein diacylglyceryl transferase n=1 Tax=Ulvibacter litoralis TaxID=227084 RepID=A0A1G7BVD2_9FLAO|nr:prolipoprotein diacylglyceryl transferase [Ulvibacter litoralis]GHC49838.1 prolipoprotein diacylglyceryl transferase [Ulvibacter litoralis]SDE30316.1 prolipoprotein diacylglyceryl transferase [Ulvibacter litoralis]